VSETAIFPSLSVEDNLRVGGAGLSGGEVRSALRRSYERFPLLHERRRSSAGDLSGGQRKLLGLAKALFRRPSVLVMDEPSAGLSPLLVNELVVTLAEVRSREGLTLLLAEQNAKVLELADKVTILSGGRNRFDGTIEAYRAQTDIAEQLFGLHATA
jgi:branched-chain amino acid transport system ATP-binding protein